MAAMAKVISFDFDGTLTVPRFDEALGLWVNSDIPNPRMVGLLRRLAGRGFEIHIVTRRFSKFENALGPTEDCSVAEFLSAHNLSACVCEVHFCGDADPSGDKTATLKRIGAIAHYDDSEEFLAQARSAGVKGKPMRSSRRD